MQPDTYEDAGEFSFKSLFTPFTPAKAVCFLIAIGFIVYFNSLFNGFVGDDNGQILTNPLVHSLSNLPQFFAGSTLFIEQVGQSAGLYYRPMLSITFATIYSFFGANAFPYHLFQLILHISNSILIFLLLRKHLKLPVSFTLSLIFLIHPINNEAVVYIANMQEELFAFYGLLAIHMLSFKKWFYAVPAFLFLSLLSKESGIIFFPIVLLYYFFFSKRTEQRTQIILYSVIGVFILYVLLRIFVGNTGLNTQFLYMSVNASFVERLYTLPSLVIYYLHNVFFPASLSFGWYWVIKTPNITNFFIPLAITITFVGSLILSLISFKHDNKQYKLFLFFFLTFLLSIGLILQIFPLDLTVADRWFYIPLFSLLGMTGMIYEKYISKMLTNKSIKMFGLSGLIVLLVFFAGRDVTRNVNWSDNYTLCSHDVLINKESYILEFCVSNELYNRGDYKNAQIHGQRAVSLYPEYFLSWYTLGKAYYATKDEVRAKDAFKQSLMHNDFGLGSEELALMYVYEKDTKSAKKLTDTYLEKMPNSAQLWYALALAEYIDGNSSEATAAAQKAYKLQPTPITEKVYTRLSKDLPIQF